MMRNLQRRQFLKGSLAATTAGVLSSWTARWAASDSVPAPSSSEAEKLTAYQVDSQVWLRWHNHPLTAYRAHPSQKYPYFYPLVGPLSGMSLTTETAQPWPHHRSLMFACDRVNGANFWQGDNAAGQIISMGAKLGATTDTSAEILDHCVWQVPGHEPIMEDRRLFRVQVASDTTYYIDCVIDWKAITDITIEKTNHSLFAVRAATDIAPTGGGVLLNSEGGMGAAETFGRPGRWCTFHGRRKGLPEQFVEGIAILQLPRPLDNCPWFTRDYGFMSPTPFNFIEQPWKLSAGQDLKLAYRVVAYAGTPQTADLEAMWRAFADEYSVLL